MSKARSRKSAELAKLAALPESRIDTSDIPEVRDWRGAQIGRFYRPVKKPVTLRLDADVIDWLKARESKYQTAVNRILRDYMREHASPQRPATRKRRAGRT